MFAADPEILQLAPDGAIIERPRAARDDVALLRAMSTAGLQAIAASIPDRPEVAQKSVSLPGANGDQIAARWYTPPNWNVATPGAAIVYFHGGGMITGSVDAYDKIVAAYVADSGVPMLSLEYRVAPEFPHPIPVQDGLAAVVWLEQHMHGVDPHRLAVMGDSGGGGVAAGVAVLARSEGVRITKQILIYPMLDDRTTIPDPHLVRFAGWSYDDNYTGWHALLGDLIGGDQVDPSAAPARLKDLSGLPPAYIEVGELDIFRDESIEYARRLSLAGVSAELHVHPGCPHGFDFGAPTADVTMRSRADRLRVIRSL